MFNIIDELEDEAFEAMETEEEEETNTNISEVVTIIARHILECAEELKDIGFNIE